LSLPNDFDDEKSKAGRRGQLYQKAQTNAEFKTARELLAAQDSQVKAATSDRYPSFFAALQGHYPGHPARGFV